MRIQSLLAPCLLAILAYLPTRSAQVDSTAAFHQIHGLSLDDAEEMCSERGFRTRALEEGGMPRIFDTFTFFNEFDLLEVRLHELYPVVHRYFRVCMTFLE